MYRIIDESGEDYMYSLDDTTKFEFVSHIYDDKTAEEVYEISSKFLDYAKKLLESLESRND